MTDGSRDGPTGPQRRASLLRYVLAWVAVGGVLVALAILVVPGPSGRDDVLLPPVGQIDLVEAARSAGCALSAGDTPGDALPTRGPASRAAEPGVYDEAVEPIELVGAMRVGVVVFHVKPSLTGELGDELRRLQASVPRGTIVTTNPRMTFAIAATAWRRSLGCPRPTRDAIDALRLFRGRFLGTGPEAP